MGEVLSQNEIDALLNQLSSGELDVESISNAEEKPVKDYDFSRPTKFSKEHLRTLEIIFEHYSRLVSTNLPVILRKNAQVTVASSETVTFSEFTNALSNPSVLGIVSFEPLGGNIIIDLATNIAFAMIDRMLGGEGEPLDKTREFSDIELSIMQKIMVMLTQLLRDPWKNVLEVSPVLTRLETNPSFAQIIAPGEMIAVITLNIKIGDVEGFMNMCLPFITLEDVMDRLNTKFWFSTMQENKDEDAQENIEAMLRRVDIPVKAVLGTSKITVNDFMNLQVGDCIRLEKLIGIRVSDMAYGITIEADRLCIKSKNGKICYRDITPQISDLLRSESYQKMIVGDKFVPPKSSSINTYLRRLEDRLGLERHSFHDIRRRIAQDNYDQYRHSGLTREEALSKVSIWLNHGEKREAMLLRSYISNAW